MTWKNRLLKMTQSKENYYASLIVDASTAAVFFFYALTLSTDAWATIALFLMGVLLFTFLEYAVHAWLFHLKHPFKVFIEGHAHHHQDPKNYDAMPFFMSAVIGLLFVGIFSLVMSRPDAFALVGGLTLGYFNYGIMHHLMHRKTFKNNYLHYLQVFHAVHHKNPKVNNGVTTDIWDRVFGTYQRWCDDKPLEEEYSEGHPLHVA